MAIKVYLGTTEGTVIIDSGTRSAKVLSTKNFSFDKNDSVEEVTLKDASDPSYALRTPSFDVSNNTGNPIGAYSDVVAYLSSLISEPATEVAGTVDVNIVNTPDVNVVNTPDVNIVNTVTVEEENFAIRIDDKTTVKTVYIGMAIIGSLDADPVWRMKKIDETSGADTTWADGDDLFNNIWDDRVTLSYS